MKELFFNHEGHEAHEEKQKIELPCCGSARCRERILYFEVFLRVLRALRG